MSTTRDLNRFLVGGLIEGRLLGAGGGDLLRQMQSEPVPTGMEGVEYGLGLFLIDAEDELGEGARVWGHEGWGHSFSWCAEGVKGAATTLVVSGTVNQQEERADPYDAVMEIIAAARAEDRMQ